MKKISGLQPSILDRRKPLPGLRSFVQEYIFRIITIPEGCMIEKTLPLCSESSIMFYLGNPFDTVNVQTDQPVPFVRCSIRGPQTRILYSIHLKGTFVSFVIKFKATGLYKLLGVPMNVFTNKSIPGSSIQELPFPKIIGQLLFAQDIGHCIQIVEPYLLSLAEGSSPVPFPVYKAIQILTRYPRLDSIADLASRSFISQRQLQRCFIKYIGVCPKTYCRIKRLLRLLRAKENKPEIKWASLAYEFGYYDQMHFIKEFKQCLNTLPSAFVPANFAY